VAAIGGTAGALKALFGVGGGLFGGFGLSKSAGLLDASAAALTRAAVVMGGGEVSAGAGAAASVGGIARAGLGAAGAITGAVLDGSEAGNKEVLSDPAVIARLAADDARKQANIDRDGWLRGSWENMFGNGSEIRRPSGDGGDGSGPHPAPGPIDAAQRKAQELRNMIDSPMDLNINSSPMDDLLRKSAQVRQNLEGINGAALRAAASIPTRLPPSLSSTQRGNFSFGGVNGE
jgi:hypothetical protein